jgi:hypothetical protein
MRLMTGSAIRKPCLAIADKDAIKKQTTSLPGSPAVRAESVATLSILRDNKIRSPALDAAPGLRCLFVIGIISKM